MDVGREGKNDSRELFHGSRGNRLSLAYLAYIFSSAESYIFLAFPCLFIRVTRIRLKSTVTIRRIIRHKLSQLEKKKKKVCTRIGPRHEMNFFQIFVFLSIYQIYIYTDASLLRTFEEQFFNQIFVHAIFNYCSRFSIIIHFRLKQVSQISL